MPYGITASRNQNKTKRRFTTRRASEPHQILKDVMNKRTEEPITHITKLHNRKAAEKMLGKEIAVNGEFRRILIVMPSGCNLKEVCSSCGINWSS